MFVITPDQIQYSSATQTHNRTSTLEGKIKAHPNFEFPVSRRHRPLHQPFDKPQAINLP